MHKFCLKFLHSKGEIFSIEKTSNFPIIKAFNGRLTI